jgi:hypothetical protein
MILLAQGVYKLVLFLCDGEEVIPAEHVPSFALFFEGECSFYPRLTDCLIEFLVVYVDSRHLQNSIIVDLPASIIGQDLSLINGATVKGLCVFKLDQGQDKIESNSAVVTFKAIQYYPAVADVFVESGQAHYDVKHTLLAVEGAVPCSISCITFCQVKSVHDSQAMWHVDTKEILAFQVLL